MKRLCITLHESVSREQIDYAAYENWWVVARIIKANPSENIPDEIIFQTDDDQNFIHYTLEQVNGYPYLIVEGESIEETVDVIRSSLPTYPREDVIRMLQAPVDREEYLKGILYLGLLGRFQDHDNETLEMFRQILQNTDPEIRISGFFGMGYSGWSEFRDIAQHLAENDPDEGVRRTAARFLEGLELYPASAMN
jgi:hypothetical protein